MGLLWILFRRRSELRCIAKEFCLLSSGTVKELRARISSFASKDDHPEMVIARLAALEAYFSLRTRALPSKRASWPWETDLRSPPPPLLLLIKRGIMALVSINGHRAVGILDTGANRSFISKRAAQQLAKSPQFLKVNSQILLADHTRKIVRQALKVTVQLDQQQVTINMLVLPDIKDDVILGLDFLSRVNFVLQCDRLRFRLNITKKSDQESSSSFGIERKILQVINIKNPMDSPSPGPAKINCSPRFLILKGRIMARVLINGHHTLGTIDTGSNSSYITERAAQRMSIADKFHKVESWISLADGTVKPVAQAIRATVQLDQQQVTINMFVISNIMDQVILGLDYLSKINAVLHCGRLRLPLEAAPSEPPQSSGDAESGPTPAKLSKLND